MRRIKILLLSLAAMLSCSVSNVFGSESTLRVSGFLTAIIAQGYNDKDVVYGNNIAGKESNWGSRENHLGIQFANVINPQLDVAAQFITHGGAQNYDLETDWAFIDYKVLKGDKMMQRLFKLHTTLMKKGNVESMVKLGIMYQRGEGVSKNSKKAHQLFKQAAGLGNKSAIELLNKSSEKKLDAHLKLRTFNKAVPKRRVKNIVNPPVAEKQWQIDNRIARQKADAETAILETENQKRAEQIDLQEQLALDKQNLLEAERLKVQQAREQWVRERAEALEINHEIELATAKKLAEEKRKQKALADQQLEIEKLLVEKGPTEKSQEKQQKMFSSNPCDTPIAKFMSTCL